MMECDEVIRRLHRAYGVFSIRDRQLLELDANERSLTHKLAEHLQVEFPEWHVDCEYNRDGVAPKRLNLSIPVSAEDTDAVTVFPDIVVHRRGTSDNLVVIEAKKSNARGAIRDEEKLAAYVADLGYRFPFKVVFPIGPLAPHASADTDIIGFAPAPPAQRGGSR